MVTKTVDLSEVRDLDITEVTLRSVNGDDTVEAAGRCMPLDGKPIDENLFGMMLRQQVIAQAVTGYATSKEGRVKVVGPCLESLRWSARTREFVGMVFDYLNGVSEAEREDFRKALATPKSTPGSSDIAAAG